MQTYTQEPESTTYKTVPIPDDVLDEQQYDPRIYKPLEIGLGSYWTAVDYDKLDRNQ